MKTFIHIGQPKTGTTSIQHYLQSNQNELAKQQVYFPREILGHQSPSHYLLNVYALDKERYSYKKEILIEEHGLNHLKELKTKLPEAIEKTYVAAKKEGAGKIIWSNEGLYLLNSQTEYQRLLGLFTPYSDEVTIICCFRELQSFRKSYLDELSKNGLSILNDKNSYRYIKENSWLWDEERKKYLLKSLFTNTIFFKYHPQDNVRAFCDAIDVQFAMTEGQRLNITSKRWWQRFL